MAIVITDLSGEIIDAVEPYAAIILPLLIIGFFLVTFIVIGFPKENLRESYIAGFLIALLFFNTIGPAYVLPFMHWHKFSGAWDEEQTEYQFRIVDAENQELIYDRKATLGFEGVPQSRLAKAMVADNEFSEEENCEIMQWFLIRGQEYRSDIENRPPPYVIPDRDPIGFPMHGWENVWTEDQLNEHAEFVGIRVYQLDMRTSEDGTEVVEYSEEVKLEYYESSANTAEQCRGTVEDSAHEPNIRVIERG